MSDVRTTNEGSQGRQDGRIRAGAVARTPNGNESGQALIEFALVLPLLILIVVAIIDFGLAMNTWNTAQNAAREAARVAAVSDSAPTIKKRAFDNMRNSGITLKANEIELWCNRPSLDAPGPDTIPVFYNCTDSLRGNVGCDAAGPCAGRTWDELKGDIVEVRVRPEYEFITPLGRLLGRGGSITVKATIQTSYEGVG